MASRTVGVHGWMGSGLASRRVPEDYGVRDYEREGERERERGEREKVREGVRERDGDRERE